MTDETVLENIYQESLEESMVSYIAQRKNLSFEDALDKYYSSKLSVKIHDGVFGVQYLDYRNLVEILFETEPELFD